MTICPKCGQASSNDKICSNCWSDMNAKSKPKPVKDVTDFKWKNIVLLGVLLIVVFYLLTLMLDSMRQNINPATPAAVIVTPSVTETPSIVTPVVSPTP